METFSKAPPAASAATANTCAESASKGPLTIETQGSYFAGGTVFKGPGAFEPRAFMSTSGGLNHAGHAYVRFQRPQHARALPIVLWHGSGQFMRTWETTPDGREGYDSLLLRRGWEVHMVDQPGRGGAGHTNNPAPTTPFNPIDKSLWQIFRLGLYPDFFPGVQFPQTPEAIDQYFRQRVDDVGVNDTETILQAIAAVLGRIGHSILVTHSASGSLGFITAAREPSVRAVISYEPGSTVFPDDYTPEVVSPRGKPRTLPAAQFERLTKIPIHIVFGDNIPTDPSPYPGLDMWRHSLAYAKEFRDLVNGRGGDVTIAELPKEGLRGNTHFPFSDLNNLEVVDLLSKYLSSRGLDKHG